MKTILIFFLSLTLFIPTGFAATGLKELLREYQYEVTVVWDQKDPEVLKAYEQKLMHDIDYLLKTGTHPIELMETSIESIPDEVIRNQMQEALKLYQIDKMTKEELTYMIEENSKLLGAQGSSLASSCKNFSGSSCWLRSS